MLVTQIISGVGERVDLKICYQAVVKHVVNEVISRSK